MERNDTTAGLVPFRAAEARTTRAAAYCRVSTEDENQETSLEGQISHWRAYIEGRENWLFAGVYSEAGRSGTRAETRPELMRLIGDCRDGKIDIVLTKSISRFSRNTVDCLRLVRELKAMGVGVVFEKEGIDTGSMDSELFLSVLSAFATEESRSLSGNVKLGYRHRFQQGLFKYKRPPYGYRAEAGELVPDEREAGHVAEIFASVLAGASPRRIAESLAERGVPTKYSAAWTSNTVTAIVTNITYTGDSLLQKTWKDERYAAHPNRGEQDQYYVPDQHEGLVSRETFVLANLALGFKDPYARIRPWLEAEDGAGQEERRVTVIRARPRAAEAGPERLRVAAYCRVSTDAEEQESSYEAQCGHYHGVITTNENWTLAGIYADEGITGTCLKRREQFNRMVADAEAGKIDLILTKSISRFARNTLDCLAVIRRLKDIGVGVCFEKEGLNTLDGTGEVILTILASIAQQESASISQNVRLGIQYRFQQGKPMINCSRFLGYDKDGRGRLIINEAQAVVVRRIYRDFLDGLSADRIAADLRREGVASGAGCVSWPVSSVRYILENEKYCGCLLLQKTLVEDFLTHKLVRNRGQLPQYYVENAHPPIVPGSVFDRVRDEIWLRGAECPPGGNRHGSRLALVGRTVCPCGSQMARLRRREPVFACRCGAVWEERAIKRRVMAAVRRLPECRADIERRIAALAPELQSGDRMRRARARREAWRLQNLLMDAGGGYGRECRDEADFRQRTGRVLRDWDDDALSRIILRVEAGRKVVFVGGVEVMWEE